MLWLEVRGTSHEPKHHVENTGRLILIPPAAEYEFYQFRAPTNPSDTPISERNSSSTAKFLTENPVDALPPLTEGMFGYSLTRPVHNQEYYYGVFDACEKFRCGIEGWHTETGPGVYEAVCGLMFQVNNTNLCELLTAMCRLSNSGK